MTTTPLTQDEQIDALGRYGFGWADSDVAGASAQRGLSEAVVRDISAKKSEPEWMLEHRLKGLSLFDKKPMPNWGSDLSEIDFDNIKYFVRSTEKQAATWDDLPADIKNTYDKLGIPEAEKQRLVSGVAAQYESEVVYHQINEELEKQGVIFMDTDTGLKEHPELFQEYFGSVIPSGDNKFSALNSAVWSGGSFIYVPKGVHVEIPLQAYFRINTENMGQFERTLIIVDEGAYVHYVEGCTAPIYKSDSLHSAVVEIIVKKGGRCRYTTIQNWSNNVYNLVTKRAKAEAGATMEWVDGNIGSKVTMKYPAVWMTGEYAKGEVLSIAFAGEGQHQDAGAKMLHLAPHTSSTIISKSVARGGGRTSYRGLVQVNKGAHHSKSTVKCDALLVDDISRSDTYPYVDVREDDVSMGHEATVSKVSEDQLFYLMSRGLSEDEAMAMVVRGFVEPIARELPMEYALELNRLIELQMEGAVG
jgi:Fe-S cluster assembly protein SufB